MNKPGHSGGSGWRLLLLPMAFWVLLPAVGYWPTVAIGGLAAVKAMVAAQAVVLLLVYGTLLPGMRMMTHRARSAPVMAMVAAATEGRSEESKTDAERRFQVAFRVGAVRFLATVVIAGAVAWFGWLDRSVFLLWLAISYVLMIKAETLALLGWMKTLERQPCS